MASVSMVKEEIHKEIEELFNITGGISVDKSRVLSVLRTGSFIKTQFYGIGKWSVNVVLDNSNGFLTIPYIEDDGLTSLLIGDTLRCRFAIENYDVNIMCVVKDMKLKHMPTKTLEIVKAEIWKNKRGSSRQNANFMCKGIDELGEEFSCYLVNLSNSGSGVICKENIRVGSNIKLKFYGPSMILSELTAIVVRSKRIYDHKFEYGTKFVNINNNVKDFLDILLSSEKSNEMEMYIRLCKNYGITNVFF